LTDEGRRLAGGLLLGRADFFAERGLDVWAKRGAAWGNSFRLLPATGSQVERARAGRTDLTRAGKEPSYARERSDATVNFRTDAAGGPNSATKTI